MADCYRIDRNRSRQWRGYWRSDSVGFRSNCGRNLAAVGSTSEFGPTVAGNRSRSGRKLFLARSRPVFGYDSVENRANRGRNPTSIGPWLASSRCRRAEDEQRLCAGESYCAFPFYCALYVSNGCERDRERAITHVMDDRDPVTHGRVTSCRLWYQNCILSFLMLLFQVISFLDYVTIYEEWRNKIIIRNLISIYELFFF